MPFIIAKTVTYVSSLSVTYVTTLYIPAARQVMVFETPDEWYQAVGRYGFAQPGCSLRGDTARAAGSRPYSGVYDEQQFNFGIYPVVELTRRSN